MILDPKYSPIAHICFIARNLRQPSSSMIPRPHAKRLCDIMCLSLWRSCTPCRIKHLVELYTCSQAWACFAGEGERVALGRNLKARGPVEVWLLAVESQMRTSLRAACKKGIRDYEAVARSDWIRQQPAQLVIVVSNIFWCKAVSSFVPHLCSTPISGLQQGWL